MNAPIDPQADVAKLPRIAWRAGPLLLLALLAAMLMWWQSHARRNAPTGPATGKSVALVIDSGQGDPQWREVSHRAGMTVFDQLQTAAVADESLTFAARGSGEATFVTSINGIENEGAGDNAKNWLYRVNTKKAHQSCALYNLEPGDRVLWKFGPYE